MSDNKEHELRDDYEIAVTSFETVDDWIEAVKNGNYYRSDIMALLAQRDQARAELTVSQQQTEKWIGSAYDLGKELAAMTAERDALVLQNDTLAKTLERYGKLKIEYDGTTSDWGGLARDVLAQVRK